jgi:Host cell surface-exposed lipoprotein
MKKLLAPLAMAGIALALAGCNTKTTKASSATTAAPAATAPASTAAPATTAPPTTATPTTTKPKLTLSQQNAIAAAQQYLGEGTGFSQAGLIAQLDSPDGDGYSVADATFAVDSLNVDWNAQAVDAAKGYLQTSSFSCTDLVQQLDSPDGSQFTPAQAEYAAKAVGLCS